MKRIRLNRVDEIIKECARPQIDSADLGSIIESVFEKVKSDGDKALYDLTLEYDKAEIVELQVNRKEIKRAKSNIDEDLKSAIQLAKSNIDKFHRSQIIKKEIIETSPGVECWQEARPIQKVGLYIPGGSAPLFSTILMLGIPAKIAGCQEIVLCTPPNIEGKINDAILYTADLIGIQKIYKVGGSQAIAAMTFGTESIPSVNKIFGPGNQFVTAAKQFAQMKGVAIDMPAGPSELLVWADETCVPEFVASDLLSQAEHGADSQVICVVESEQIASQIEDEIEIQLGDLDRKEIAKNALENSKMVIIQNEGLAIEFVNEYAPEHLIIAKENADSLIEDVINAGSVFIGNYTPESAGDYASGTNHTLPTNGFAKSFSGVNLDAFTKKITFQKISREGIANIGPAIEKMAEAESLSAHKLAVTKRLNEIKILS